jgi:hypothetical protein
MAVNWVQTTTWGPITNDGDWQRNYFRIPFAGTPHILASAYLNEVSIGLLNDVPGLALAGFKRFEFLGDNGLTQETEVSGIVSWIDVPRCVSITIAFDLRAATGCAGWTYYYLA